MSYWRCQRYLWFQQRSTTTLFTRTCFVRKINKSTFRNAVLKILNRCRRRPLSTASWSERSNRDLPVATRSRDTLISMIAASKGCYEANKKHPIFSEKQESGRTKKMTKCFKILLRYNVLNYQLFESLYWIQRNVNQTNFFSFFSSQHGSKT